MYDLKWKSGTKPDIGKDILKKGAMMALVEVPLLFIPGPQEVVAAKWILNTWRFLRVGARVVYYGAGVFSEGNDRFVEAIKNAKLTGRLIAIALVLGYPFTSQTVSLMGFSLGSQVIKSCLSTLYKLRATDIIHNVTFLAGATHFEKKNTHP